MTSDRDWSIAQKTNLLNDMFKQFVETAQSHPAGDVTRVSVVPRKVTVKIGDSDNWWWGFRDNNRLKKAKIPVRLVLSRVPFKFGV